MEMDSDKLQRLLFAYIDIANADDFIHENELILFKMQLIYGNYNPLLISLNQEKLIIVKDFKFFSP